MSNRFKQIVSGIGLIFLVLALLMSIYLEFSHWDEVLSLKAKITLHLRPIKIGLLGFLLFFFFHRE